MVPAFQPNSHTSFAKDTRYPISPCQAPDRLFLNFFACTPFDALPDLAHVAPPDFESGPTRPLGHFGQAARNSRFTGRPERRGAGRSVASRRRQPRRLGIFGGCFGPFRQGPAGARRLPHRQTSGATPTGTRDVAPRPGQAPDQAAPLFPRVGCPATRGPTAARRCAERTARDAHPLGQAPTIRHRPGHRHHRRRPAAADLFPGRAEKPVPPLQAWPAHRPARPR